MTQQEIDLQKIQTLESSYQGWFNFKASIATGGVVGFVILFATVYFEGTIDLTVLIVANALIYGLAFYMAYDMSKTHDKHIKFIDDLVKRVELGEKKLESIMELKKKVTEQILKSKNKQCKNRI